MAMARRDLKVSFNPTIENHYVLEDARYNSNLSLTQIINNYIDFTTNLDESIKMVLVETIDREIEARMRLKTDNSVLLLNNLTNQVNQLVGLKHLLTNYINPNSIIPPSRINLKEGYLQYPDNWMLINAENAFCSTRAYIVELVNYPAGDSSHFVYFDDLKELDEDFYMHIEMELVKKYPQFEDAITNQVRPIYEEGKPQIFKNLINKDDYVNCPIVAIALVKTIQEVRQIRLWDSGYIPPANVQIVK